ncbi:MAG: outer membrane protein assembly factor BamE [Candidatus Sphingomonas colombiensis]|nr:outer membrane protein assembly factor BamE [Sphingomonas sp.]WEK44630.1 MAG: outer membrane protein assembly factor BamE [Sphingomonas sp.]
MRQPILIAALAGIVLAGCVPLRSHQGYIVDADLVNAIQPGVDNRDSVLATLGHPTFAAQFNQGDWYYISRDSRNLAYNLPKPKDQLTLQISFDRNGTVSAVRRSGEEQVASIRPDKKTTPTLGRTRGFFSDLFGNIGAVGAPGMGGGGGGGRDTP